MSFSSHRNIKANRGRKNGKPHWCYWCGEDIKIGAKAVYFANIYEGDFCAGYMHPECDLAFHEEWRETYEPVEFTCDCLRGRRSDDPLDVMLPAMFREEYDEILKHEEITPYVP